MTSFTLWLLIFTVIPEDLSSFPKSLPQLFDNKTFLFGSSHAIIILYFPPVQLLTGLTLPPGSLVSHLGCYISTSWNSQYLASRAADLMETSLNGTHLVIHVCMFWGFLFSTQPCTTESNTTPKEKKFLHVASRGQGWLLAGRKGLPVTWCACPPRRACIVQRFEWKLRI